MAHSVKFAGNELALQGNEVKVGDKAQAFTCVGLDLKPVSLADFAGKVKILSIFPSIDTPVCSLQAGKFEAQAAALGNDVAIIAISNDLPFALGRYCGAKNVKSMVMASDHRDLDFGLKYGFVLSALRLLARGVVVIDKDDVVRYVEYVPEVTEEPNYDKALEAAKALL